MHHHRLFRARFALPLTVAAGLLAALAVSTTVGFAKATVKPDNSAPPTISGTAQVGSTLTASNGTWTGTTPITYTYQWRRCDQNGGSCSNISGAIGQTYTLANVDSGNTLRVVVTAQNADGTSSATSVPTGVVAAAPATPQPAPTGCPKTTQSTSAVAVTDVSTPARLQIDAFSATPNVITSSTRSFQLRVHVTDTCGQPVSGANVYATAVPYNQVTIPPETPTGSDGWVTLTFNRMGGFPLSVHQQLMALFLRASKPGENLLAGISTRRLVSLRVQLH
ncbi:MAG: hypothetical protein JO186_04100 [Actinobacteria bacterium]|nr:hypothetical protein [Actinomycetota bacterium]MBV8598914.1 hypothetical protein [Actinomycetota bacterium]